MAQVMIESGVRAGLDGHVAQVFAVWEIEPDEHRERLRREQKGKEKVAWSATKSPSLQWRAGAAILPCATLFTSSKIPTKEWHGARREIISHAALDWRWRGL